MVSGKFNRYIFAKNSPARISEFIFHVQPSLSGFVALTTLQWIENVVLPLNDYLSGGIFG